MDRDDPEYQLLLDSRKLDSESAALQRMIRREEEVVAKIAKLANAIERERAARSSRRTFAGIMGNCKNAGTREKSCFEVKRIFLEFSVTARSKGPTMDVIYRTIKSQYEFAAAKAVQVENLARAFRKLKIGNTRRCY
jgi:hypothetical protein